MKLSLVSTLLASIVSLPAANCQATGTIDEGPFPDDLNGSNFTYQWPVKLFKFQSQLQNLEMAFMDVPPQLHPNATTSADQTVVLFHGKNFCAPTWVGTIEALTAAGYRVIAPDQIGFCKSSKPADYQYSLHQLSWNTRGLLDTLGIEKATVIGHSMGGMLAARFGLQYPDFVENLVSVNALGYEDYIAKGVPYISIEESVEDESASNYTTIREYQQEVYYVGEWKPEYDIWVNMSVNIYHGSEREAFVRAQARIVDMVLTQPVAPYFEQLKPPTLLIIGEKDKTAIGAGWSPPEVAEKLGKFDELGPEVVGRLKDGELIRFPALGHSPQISHPDIFHENLLEWLKR